MGVLAAVLGPRWDACSADFLRYYGVDLRDAVDTWPVAKLVSLVRKLPVGSQLAREELGDQADWGYLAENVAKLVDVMNFWITHEYAHWTADPDEVEERRQKQKRAGIKPPPFPLIQPVAARPPSLRELMVDQYMELASGFQLPAEETQERLVTLDEFDALLELG